MTQINLSMTSQESWKQLKNLDIITFGSPGTLEDRLQAERAPPKKYFDSISL